MMKNSLLTKKEVIEISKNQGYEQAYNILLLARADNFDGSFEEFKELQNFLEKVLDY